MNWILGLDLGQALDFTALVAVEQQRQAEPWRYGVRYLERFPLGTPYTDLTARLGELVAKPPLSGCTLAVDRTGVGRAVVDLLKQAGLPVHLRPITITGGKVASRDHLGSQVPKKDLISVLEVLLETRRLQIDARLPLADTLRQELENFTVKISATAHEIFGAGQRQQHDDLVMALALAAWVGENMPKPYTGPLVCYPVRTLPAADVHPLAEILREMDLEDERQDWSGPSSHLGW